MPPSVFPHPSPLYGGCGRPTQRGGRGGRSNPGIRVRTQEEDTINTTELQTKLKDIPVPISLEAERAKKEQAFVQTAEYIRAPPAPSTSDSRVLWDIDAAGYRFFKTLNAGSSVYKGPPLDETLFERIIDSFERAVRVSAGASSQQQQ